MTEPVDYTIRYDEQGRISSETIRTMFSNVCCRTPSMPATDDAWKGFLIGVRCLDRMLRDLGFETRIGLGGRTITEKKQPHKVPCLGNPESLVEDIGSATRKS